MISKKLLEIHPVKNKYINFDKDVLKFKAMNFENSCFLLIHDDKNVEIEYKSRKDIVDKCKQEIYTDFFNIHDETMQERERLLPPSVSEAWANFKLYANNIIVADSEKIVASNGKRYIWEEYVDSSGDVDKR